MTSREARSFDRVSPRSYVQVDAQLSCDCKPYDDVYTFKRWIAQGFCVRKGEKAIKLQTFVEGKRSAPDAGDSDAEVRREGERPYLVARTLSVFCRCQVKELETK